MLPIHLRLSLPIYTAFFHTVSVKQSRVCLSVCVCVCVCECEWDTIPISPGSIYCWLSRFHPLVPYVLCKIAECVFYMYGV